MCSSLPRPGKNRCSIIEVTRIPAEDVAAQLTLIDAELFKNVDLEELYSCGWIKKNKQQIAPNVVAYTRRFNHVSNRDGISRTEILFCGGTCAKELNLIPVPDF